MSLLWTEASHHKVSMPWWNKDEPGEYEEHLRDPEESLRDRGQRYKQQVMDGHGVGASTAQRAIQHVVKHLDTDAAHTDPVKYGFASSGWGPRVLPDHIMYTVADPATWKGVKEQDVDLTEPIHATQDFVRHHSIAHNLFHPGKKQPDYEDEAVGDPDYDPDRYRDDDESHGSVLPPEERADHSKVYFLRRNNGKMHVVDGHHRVATNLLLGKKSMRGMVIHEHEIPGPPDGRITY